MRLVVLGSTGLLGQAVVGASNAAGLSSIEVSRFGPTSWNYFESQFMDLERLVELNSSDVVVNCIGWIPQKSSGDAFVDSSRARALNVELVREIQASQERVGFGWMQILTDCVFSGKEGNYSEESAHSPIDLYGQTKAEGETLMRGAMKVRASIVGRDPLGKGGLFEWFNNLPEGSQVQGYSNHFWNGVSTIAFAKLTIALASEGLLTPSLQHWVPEDSVSKHELLSMFKRSLARRDIRINSTERGEVSNRVLTTLDSRKNLELWKLAGYSAPPSIEDLVTEFIGSNQKEEK